jgi:formylglycine-generating enzyme required for sulfatase activity
MAAAVRGIVAAAMALSATAAGEPAWVQLPAGIGLVGCPAEHPCAKTFPQKSVSFPAGLELMRYEVTVAQFRAFVQATGHQTYSEAHAEKRTWRNPGYKLEENQPVVLVTVNDAAAYCASVGARLPSDAEWEYAARAGTKTAHYWGDEIDDRYAWYRLNSKGRPHKGGGKRPNRWGLYDMEGNVFEWVVADPEHTAIPKQPELVGSLRGGSWITCPEPYPPKDGVRQRTMTTSVPFPSGTRQHFDTHWRRDDAGFRCIRGQRR